MPFDQGSLTGVSPPRVRGGQVYCAWQSTSPAGTWFQVYVNRRLAWPGRRRWTWLPVPPGPMRVDIGAVGAGEQETDWSATLPPPPGRRLTLRWQSGKYAGAGLAGFHIYGSDSPGGAVDYTVRLADIPAYPAGIDTSGFGLGGFGGGGFGLAPSSYSWTSPPLSAGAWTFAVVPYDSAGNEGAATTTTEAIAGPPREPAPAAGSTSRLSYTLQYFGSGGFGGGGFGLGQPVAVLTWLPSPA